MTINGKLHISCPPWMVLEGIVSKVVAYKQFTKYALTVPVGIAVSPNNALICSITASSNITSRTAVHSGPRHRHTSPVANPARSDISRVLVCAICSRNSPSDIIHALVALTTPIEIVTVALYGALAILDAHSFGLHDMWKNEIMGIATEVYLYGLISSDLGRLLILQIP